MLQGPVACPYCGDAVVEGGSAGYAFVRSTVMLHFQSCRSRPDLDVEEIATILDQIAADATDGLS